MHRVSKYHIRCLWYQSGNILGLPWDGKVTWNCQYQQSKGHYGIHTCTFIVKCVHWQFKKVHKRRYLVFGERHTILYALVLLLNQGNKLTSVYNQNLTFTHYVKCNGLNNKHTCVHATSEHCGTHLIRTHCKCYIDPCWKYNSDKFGAPHNQDNFICPKGI